MPLLEASGVKKIFGKLTALDGAALTVGENEFHGLIGPNGSGKSTLMKCIAGAEVPTQGKVSFVNADITAFTPTERARAGMSLKFQITSVLPTLTLYDNILLALQAQSSLFDLVFSRTRGLLHDQVMTMLTQFRLANRAFDAAAALSHGQQQWLEIAMALACKPKLLLLDEPTGGMSLEERRVTGELLQPIKSIARWSSSSTISISSATSAIVSPCSTRARCWRPARCRRSRPTRPSRRFICAVPEFWTSSISTPAMVAARSCSTSTSAFPGAAVSPCWAATAPARPR